MLQDPVKAVLVPLAPEEARALATVPITLEGAVGFGEGAWVGLDRLAACSGEQRLPLGDSLGQLMPTRGEASYEEAYAAMIGGDHLMAGEAFLIVALTGGPLAPSLYGLALTLERLEAYEQAEQLAGFVSDLPGYDDPRAAALAGYAAFQRRQAKAARVHLAKAARIARTKPEFRGVQRFAQRVLLMQQFALGD